MIAKTYISETHGLGVLITGVVYTGDQPYENNPVPVDQLHTWFAKPDPQDGEYLLWPVVNGQVFNDPDNDAGPDISYTFGLAGDLADNIAVSYTHLTLPTILLV